MHLDDSWLQLPLWQADGMKVAAVQFDFDESESFDARVGRALAFVAAEADADLVVLPELWPNGGFTYQAWESTAQPLDGPLVTSHAGRGARRRQSCCTPAPSSSGTTMDR